MCASSPKTQELLTLAREGDRSALDQLCSVYCERVRRLVRFRMNRKLRSKLDSMDLVQDALLHALKGLEGFTYSNEGDFTRWLSKVVENELRGNLRKLHADKRDIRKEVRLRRHRPTTAGSFAGPVGPIETTSPSAIMSKKEDLDRLERAIDELNPQYKEVIILAKIEGLSYKAIASKLGKSAEAVRKLVSRATAELTVAFGGI